MTDQIGLTAAELSFALTALELDPDEPAWRLLGLTDEERSPAVISAGFGSLLIRGLAVTKRGQFTLAPAVAAVVEGLVAPKFWAEIGVIAPDTADGSLLFETGAVRFLIAPRAHRCFDVVGLNRSADLRTILLPLIQGFLERHQPAAASILIEKSGSHAFTLAVDETGQWLWGADPRPGDVLASVTKAEAFDAFWSAVGSTVLAQI
jgi:hypothetical protein